MQIKHVLHLTQEDRYFLFWCSVEKWSFNQNQFVSLCPVMPNSTSDQRLIQNYISVKGLFCLLTLLLLARRSFHQDHIFLSGSACKPKICLLTLCGLNLSAGISFVGHKRFNVPAGLFTIQTCVFGLDSYSNIENVILWDERHYFYSFLWCLDQTGLNVAFI